MTTLTLDNQKSASPPVAASAPARLTSLDAYRGFVMFLMMPEVLSLSRVAEARPDSAIWQFFAHHQSHVSWIGCSLRDLIVIGMNSISAYCMAHLIDDFLGSSLTTHLGANAFKAFGAACEPLVHGALVLLVMWLLLFWMYRREIFLRI